MRNRLALKSSLIGVLVKATEIVVAFFVTRYYTLYLGVEIRGLNGIFNNVLGFLRLAELGIGTAIIYALYQPVVDGNIEEIKSIMSLYRRLYRWIFAIIVTGGIILIPAMFYFVGDTEISHSYVLITYLISLASTASTYLLSYRRNLLYADQKQYIIVLIEAAANLVFSIGKIVAIVLTKSFVLMLVIQFAQNICLNSFIHIYCGNKYKYLKDRNVAAYDKVKELMSNVKNIFVGRIGGWVYSSTDNLLISKFVGLEMVGFMYNYYLIKSTLTSLIAAICTPIRPMIGNYIREEKDRDKQFDMFCTFSFITFFMATVTVGEFVVLGDNLVRVWLGEEYTVSEWIVIWLGADLFISVIHEPLCEFISAFGFFKEDRNMSVAGMLINLISSVILAIPFGVEGVLLGTFISQIYYWIRRTTILFSGYFGKRWKKYVFSEVRYVIISVLGIGILTVGSKHIPKASGWGMLTVYGFAVLFCISVFAIALNIGHKELKNAVKFCLDALHCKKSINK